MTSAIDSTTVAMANASQELDRGPGAGGDDDDHHDGNEPKEPTTVEEEKNESIPSNRAVEAIKDGSLAVKEREEISEKNGAATKSGTASDQGRSYASVVSGMEGLAAAPVSATTLPAAGATDITLDEAAKFLSAEELESIRLALGGIDLPEPTNSTQTPEPSTASAKPHQTQTKEPNTSHVSPEELEQIQQALRASEEDSNGLADAVNSEAISETEQAAIERAIREADAAEEAKSFALALRMQEEEDRYRQSRQQQESFPPLSTEPYAKVRTLTRAELRAEQRANQGAYSGFEPQRRSMTVDLYHDGDDTIPAPSGFRMNAAVEHEWSRRDRDSIIGPNDEVRTKHDVSLDSEANAHRLGLSAADEASMIGNRAFNSFRQNMKRQTKKGVVAHGTGRAGSDSDGTKAGAMDAAAMGQITRAINAEWINKLNGVVKEGKEAVVYHADKGKESGGFDVSVKVFKRIQEFRGRGDYVDGDPRFSGAPFKNATSRQQLELWTEKEYRNLIRANRAGVPVPTPLMYKDNILFMRFLGTQGWPAPQLRELDLRKGSKKWKILYGQVISAIQSLYKGAKLVHGDLSEYNIMVVPAFLVENVDPSIEDPNTDLQAVLIDFGQAVDHRHPDSDELLQRDIDRVSSFFSRQGTETMSVADAMKMIKDKTKGEGEGSQIVTINS